MTVSVAKKIELSAPATGRPIFNLVAPATGDILLLDKLDDPIVQAGLLGSGVGIVMTTGEIVAPTNCIVEQIDISKSQVRLVNPKGLKLLLQIGETGAVKYGERIQWQVKSGQRCKQGTSLVKTDPLWIKQQGALPVCILTIVNGAKLGAIVLTTDNKVRAADDSFLTLYV
ncbi:PTS glucose transporter subunit IIA [Alteromonas lipolytica]|uniref:PTS system glucose-specific EIIA component n=1 Tax=Alteromonas lipolytica TaxID=1856405 RepID=A0A1E8FK72_9ALTE|nr:PTS glucose transporter subunit IIA [Alteromonas lipolytica]OFI36330.1 hypothetical protein BFC17_00170 [Alteromonas lipolytica]GGF70768.1 hypothetical protein GCM10011338_23670 [Alteromonas lipolytica]